MKFACRVTTTALMLGLAAGGLSTTAHAAITDTFEAEGDTIYQNTKAGVAGKIMIGLTTEHPWDRVIAVHDKSGHLLEVEKVNGEYQTTECLVLTPRRLGETVTIEFWKAKLLGLRAKVYEKTLNTSALVGQSLTFAWLEGKGERVTSSVPAPGASGRVATSDNDGISVYNLDGQAGRVRIRLSTPAWITWWKCVKVFDNRGQAIEIRRENGKYLSADINLPRDRFDSTIKVEFWKAKAFGVPAKVLTQVYDADTFDGRALLFSWYQD